MAEEHEPAGAAADRESSVTALVSGIVRDAQLLMRQELQLARVEIKHELAKTREAALSFGVGAALAAWGFVLLSLAVVFLLAWATGMPLWSWFAILGGVCVLAGGVLLAVGKRCVEDIHLVPSQTAQTLQENVQWIRSRT